MVTVADALNNAHMRRLVQWNGAGRRWQRVHRLHRRSPRCCMVCHVTGHCQQHSLDMHHADVAIRHLQCMLAGTLRASSATRTCLLWSQTLVRTTRNWAASAQRQHLVRTLWPPWTAATYCAPAGTPKAGANRSRYRLRPQLRSTSVDMADLHAESFRGTMDHAFCRRRPSCLQQGRAGRATHSSTTSTTACSSQVCDENSCHM
jgi:hypothetical protein